MCISLKRRNATRLHDSLRSSKNRTKKRNLLSRTVGTEGHIAETAREEREKVEREKSKGEGLKNRPSGGYNVQICS